jgi:hypothetical protein
MIILYMNGAKVVFLYHIISRVVKRMHTGEAVVADSVPCTKCHFEQFYTKNQHFAKVRDQHRETSKKMAFSLQLFIWLSRPEPALAKIRVFNKTINWLEKDAPRNVQSLSE